MNKSMRRLASDLLLLLFSSLLITLFLFLIGYQVNMNKME